MSGEGWVVRDEWWEMSVYVTCCMRWVRWVVWDVCVCDMWEMSGEGWVVRDEWWEMSGERWVVGDECVCDVLYEMSEMSSVRCLCMWYVVWEMNEMSGVRWWWEMSDARWVDWDEWCEVSGVRTATPNDVYTQQGAKPACQEDTNAKFSHLLLAQLPRTQFTHSKLPNPHARKTPMQNVRTSYWHSYPEHSLHTASCQTRMPGRHQCKMFAPLIGTATPNDVYAQQAAKPACQEDPNAKFSRLLLAQLPRTQYTQQGAKPACQEDITAICSHLLLAGLPPTTFTHSNVIYTQQAAKPFLEAPNAAPATETAPAAHGDQARRNPFWRFQVLRLPHRQEPRPSGDEARRNPFWRLQVLRLPRRQEPRPSGDQARRNPFWRLQVLRLPHKQQPRPSNDQALPRRQEPRPSGRNPFWRLQVQTRAAAQRRPGAPQPLLEAPVLRLPHRQEPRPSGDQARRNPFWNLQVLRLPHRQEPRPSGDQARRNPF